MTRKRQAVPTQKAPPNRFGLLNIPHHICNHLVGKNHTHRHRMVVGVVIMVSGMYTMRLFTFTTVFGQLFIEIATNSFHGIGLIPFVDYLTALAKKQA